LRPGLQLRRAAALEPVAAFADELNKNDEPDEPREPEEPWNTGASREPEEP
jgi:hypothetical protein